MIEPRTEIPPFRVFSTRLRRRKPHIYDDREIGLLLGAAAKLRSPHGLRALTYVTLIGLLVSTGLRPGEVLALDVLDVDLTHGILSIRQTKFGKSRFVPVHESTRAALARYAGRRDLLFPRRPTEAFFVSERSQRLPGGIVRDTFVTLSRCVGLRPQTPGRRGRGPRLQDFRHTFTTQTLIRWYQAGLDVGKELPKLATYLGHSDVCHSYWYMEGVPELLQLAAQRLTRRGEP